MSLAALAPIEPFELKCLFELNGYLVVAEDHYNWLVAKGTSGIPIPLPKLGALVPLDILMDTVFTKAGMDLRMYLELRAKVPGHVAGLNGAAL